MLVNREKFLHVLECCAPGVSAREIIQQSSNYVFNEGWVYTFNEEVAVTCKSPLGDSLTGAVPAEPLRAILQKLGEKEVEVEQGKNELLIKGRGGRRSAIVMESKITLPLEHLEKPGKWRDLPEKFIDAVELVQDCTSSDDAKWMLACLHIHPKWIESFDEIQFARYRLKTGFEVPILIKQTALQHIIPLGMTQVSETDTFIHFRNPQKLVLSCRRHVVQYPPMDAIVKGSAEGEPVHLPKGIIDASDRCEVFSASNSKYGNKLKVDLKPGKCWIHGDGQFGNHTEPSKLKYSGPELSFMVRPHMLKQLVTRYNDCIISPKALRAGDKIFIYVTTLGAVKGDKDKSKGTKPNAKKKKRKKVAA